MNSPYTNNMEYARSLQEKYEYYQVGLNFTLLAASIQTASFGTDKIQIGLELAGWLSLLVAGVIALLRFRMQPVAHKGFAKLQRLKDELLKYRAALAAGTREIQMVESGSLVPIEQEIAKAEMGVKENEPKLLAIEGRLILQYRWYLYFFFAGFVFVFLSRAYRPFMVLVCS